MTTLLEMYARFWVAIPGWRAIAIEWDAYRYVLLDCHSLKEKTDVLGLAPLLDGIIIVVQCNRTTTNQVYELERSIERYGGTVLGTVLNKTTYTIPAWMNSLMGRVGL